jgi:integrase
MPFAPDVPAAQPGVRFRAPPQDEGKRERRIPIDDGLWDVFKRQETGRATREPSAKTRFGQVLSELFSDRHVFISSYNTPLYRTTVYRALLRYCLKAGIATETFDAEGLPLEHVDVHSLRRTFATELIVNGADPKSVQELLGHKTLTMTMKLYAKVRPQNKRQAVAKLFYGRGVTAPSHVLEYLAPAAKAVQFGHQSVTSQAEES